MNSDAVVDEELVQYIKKNRQLHSTRKLKEGLIDQGVDEEEVNKAVAQINKEEKRDKSSKKDDSLSVDTSERREGAKGAIDPVLKAIGVKSKERSFYTDVILYGAISFVFLNIIVMVFENVGGRIIYPYVANDLGALKLLALPDVFLLNIKLWPVLLSLVWSALLGGAIAFVFFYYFLYSWPFGIWSSLFKKVFALYLIIELFFGIFINGILTDTSFIYLLGYLFIIVGMAFGSYIAAFYFVANLARKHQDFLKEFVRRRF